MRTESIDILLVEDSPFDEELTVRVLKAQDPAIRIEIVRDGAAALDRLFQAGEDAGKAAGNHPKVVLLDLKLPKVNGLEVIRRLKSASSTAAIPVVVLTSSREDRDIVECYRIGANSYIVKPVEYDQFTETVKQLGVYWMQVNQPHRF